MLKVARTMPNILKNRLFSNAYGKYKEVLQVGGEAINGIGFTFFLMTKILSMWKKENLLCKYQFPGKQNGMI
jgi:hypothetical protein